jgi:hydrogenase nickel incorporation protein HypA/HybF
MMHEYSICRRIVSAVLDAMSGAEPPPRRLLRTRVVVGRLHQIVPAYLESAYESLTGGTPASGSTLDVVQPAVRVRCAACGSAGEIEPPRFRCGACDSSDVEVVGGRELYVEHLEVESA